MRRRGARGVVRRHWGVPNRYKEIEYDAVEHRPPLEIIADIETLEDEIAKGLAELKAMLS